MRRIALIAGAVLMLAGCGGSGQSGPPTIASAAAQAGCTNVTDINTQDFMAHQSATCTYHGHDADIATFVSATEQKNWETLSKAEGAVIVKDGHGWALAEG